MAGAVFAAFAITQQRANAARRALPSFISAVLIGMAIMAVSALASHHDIGVPLSKLFLLLKQFLLYFTVTLYSRRLRFAVFSIRTSISLQLTDNGAAAQLGLPQFSCRLYGGFGTYPYFPQAARPAFAAAIPMLIIVHTLTGVPLSFCWRASGTLVLPAAAHALIDSYRNCVQ